MGYESPQVRCELRIHFCKGLDAVNHATGRLRRVSDFSGRRNTTPRCRRSTFPGAVLTKKARRRSSGRWCTL